MPLQRRRRIRFTQQTAAARPQPKMALPRAPVSDLWWHNMFLK